MLRRGLDGAGEPQDVGARSTVQQRDVGELHAARGHGARLVEDDRRDPPRALEDLRAFDEDPQLRTAAGADHESRRRGEPERAGARDDEDGDRRREGRRRIARDDEPTRERREREREHDRDEDARHAIDEPLDRRLPRLGVRNEPGDLRERSLLTDLRRANEETTERVDGRACDGVAGHDVDGHGLAGEHRLVDRRFALDDHTVGRDLLAGANDEHVSDRELVDRHRHLDAVSQDACFLRAELEKRSNRRAGAPTRTSLEVATEEDQRRDDGGDLEVDVRVVDEHERSDGPPPRRERSDRDQRVHRRRPVARVQQSRAMEAEAGPEDDGCRESEREPFPPTEVERRDHGEHDERRGERCRDDEPPPYRIGAVDGLSRLGRERRAIPGRFDRSEEIRHVDPRRVERHRGLLGRVVDGGVDAVELVELSLDPVGARRTRHPLECEVDACRGLACRGRAHAAS